MVEAVLGLDNRPQARPHFRVHQPRAKSAAPSSYTPLQVAKRTTSPQAPAEPARPSGSSSLAADTGRLTLPPTSRPRPRRSGDHRGQRGRRKEQAVDGQRRGRRVMLDVEVAASVAPGAKVAVYFTPNTDQGSWTRLPPRCTMRPTSERDFDQLGGPESSWTAQSMTAMDEACQSAAALGVTITVAAGDNGSTTRDGQQRRLSGLEPACAGLRRNQA